MKLNWGHSLFIFLALFVVAMVTFVLFSLRQKVDLVSDDYYQKGADYTQQMVIVNRSRCYGDSLQLIDRGSQIVIRYAPSIQKMADSLSILFYRPSDKKLDLTLAASLKSDSIVLDHPGLSKGRYVVQLRWRSGDQPYELSREFFAH